MKLKKRYSSRPALTITGAVEVACDGSDYGNGQLETLAQSSTKTVELVGRLILALHKKGVLSASVIAEDVLDGAFEEVP